MSAADLEYDLFIDYASDTREWVKGYLLPELGPQVRIITREEFRPGALTEEAVERAVLSSRFTVAVLSPAASIDALAQLCKALADHLGLEEQETRLIPLIRVPYELPLTIKCRVSLDCTNEDRWDSEVERFRALLDRPRQPPERVECPYPGMAPFLPGSRCFFAREDDVDDLRLRLQHQRCVYVIGPSGCGKSSLVFAGLVTELQEQEPDKWVVKSLCPGTRPAQALAAALGDAEANRLHSVRGCAVLVASVLAEKPSAQHLLLIVDQLEELFTEAKEHERADFVAALKHLGQVKECKLVLAISSYFYWDLVSSGLEPSVEGERKAVEPLGAAALREAITKPAQTIGVSLEPALVQQLLADAGEEPGVLPALLETMVLLWTKLHRRFLSLASYEKLGPKTRSGLAVALGYKADGSLSRLTEQQLTMARRILLRLVQLGDGGEDTRRQQPVARVRSAGDDPVAFEQTLSVLKNDGLLTLSGDQTPGGKRVDLSHKALITACPTFQKWLGEYREPEQMRRRIEQVVEHWIQYGERTYGLKDWREAKAWMLKYGAVLGSHEQLPSYIEACRRALILRLSSYAAVFALLVGVSLGAIRIYEGKQKAERQAEAKILAGEALKHLSQADREKALLTALQAISVTHWPDGTTEMEAQTALRAAIQGYTPGPELRSDYVRIAFSPNGTRLVLSGKEETTAVWGLDQLQKLPFTLSGHFAAFASAERLATASGKTVFLWDMNSGGKLFSLPAQEGWVTAVAFGPYGKLLATASTDGKARLWNAGSGELLRTLCCHQDTVAAVDLSTDARLLATAGWDGKAGIWDVNSGQNLRFLAAHAKALTDVAFRPHTKQLATSSNVEGQVKLWDAESGRNLRVLEANTRLPDSDVVPGITSLAFTADGAKLAAGSHDGTARVYDAESGKLLLILSHVDQMVSDVAFSPDGKRLAAASANGRGRAHIYLLDLNTEELINQALAVLNRRLTPAECQQYLLGHCH